MNSVTVSGSLRAIEGAALIRSYKESGMKLSDWLSSNNISKHKYYYWRRKLRDTYIDMCTDGDPVPDSYSFVEVPASAAAHGEREKIAPNASASVKINGCTVNISDSASVSFLRKLFEAAGNDR